jgi:WD40 repeat protein
MVKFTNSIAIAIGINNYRNGIAGLKTARPDAEKLVDLLSNDYNYQVELITDETDRKPTLTEIRTLLTEWLPQQLQSPTENNRLLFYFAGHGMPLESDDGPRGFLLPQNADPKDSLTFLPMQELHDALIALPCHHLLIILDCCFAGTFRWSSTRKSIPVPETIHRQHYDRFIRYPAWQVIASSAHNQEALDFLSDKRGTGKKDAQHSPFAEALFEALQDGEPDKKGKRYKKADLTKDGVITAPELYLYLRDNVETRSGERQTPGLFPLKKHDRGEYIFHDPKFDPNALSEAPDLDEANNPYRGLKPFEEEHARFFFGRQELIERLYARIAAPEHSLTVVLGISGSGKSSLVKAGLIPYLKQRSQAEEFATHLAKACILTSAILHSFARLPHKPWFPPRFLPIDYIHQWQILSPMRPGESPFASLARTLLAIVDTSPDTTISTQLKQLDFVSGLLENKLEQLDTQIDQLITQGKANSSKSKQLQREVETFTQLIEDWNDASLSIRQRSLVEHFEMLYSLCQTRNQETEQQQQLKQAFQDCLAPLVQQLQTDSRSLVAIVQAWAKNHPDTKLLLIIDQFEELITLGRTTQQSAKPEQIEEWQQFLNLLEKTLAADLNELCIIVTLRSDFEPRFLSSEELKPYWSKARFPVRAMRSDELRQAIESPASEIALYFEPVNLVDRLIDEVGQMPGALPLLSFTLSELYVKLADKWRNKETSDRALTIDDQFNQEGGVAGSLTRRANEEYQKIGEDPNLGEKGQRTMRRAMLRMLTLEGGETARRRVPDSELIYPTLEESDRVKQVVDRLVNARLLVRGQLETGEPYVEPAHDFLVRGWGMLQDWINEEKAKETLELQQRLTAQANDWNRSNRPVGLLLPDGDRLTQLEKILSLSENWFNQREKIFIESSIAYRNAQNKRAKELQTRVELQQKATRVENLLTVQPLNGLVLAIQMMGQNLNELEDVLTPVQTSLRNAMKKVRVSIPIEGHDSWVHSVAFSPDGQIIVSGSRDKTIRLWNTEGNPIGKPLQEHTEEVRSVAFSPDSELIVSGSDDTTIRLWDEQGNSIGQPLRGHKDCVNAVVFSPDGKLIVSGSSDGTVRLWDKQGNSIGNPFRGHAGAVLAVAVSQSGQVGMIASGGSDGTIRLWNFEGVSIGEPLRGHKGSVRSVAFSPDGTVIVSGSGNSYDTIGDNTVRLWDIQGNPIGEPIKHDENINSVAYSLDGKIIASGSNDGTIRLWDIKGEPIGEPLWGHGSLVTSVAFSPDGEMIVSGGFDDRVRLWDIRSDSVGQPFLGHKRGIYSVAFSPNGKIIASGGLDTTIQLWDMNGRFVGNPLEGHESAILAIAFSYDSQLLASGSADSTIRVWDINGNSEYQPFRGHVGGVTAVAFSPDGEMIVSGGSDKTVRLWNIRGAAIDKVLYSHNESIRSVTFDKDGRVIISGSEDNTVLIWSIESNLVIKNIQGHRFSAEAIAFSPDQQTVVSGSRDSKLGLWNFEGNLSNEPVQGHQGPICSVAFSPNGKTIASSSAKALFLAGDNTIRLWDNKGNPIGSPFYGHDDGVTSVTFSPDGQTIASASTDQTVRLWRGSWSTWLQVCCDRLRYHPVFTNPESIEDPEQREIAIAACKTCEKYVWNKAANSAE